MGLFSNLFGNKSKPEPSTSLPSTAYISLEKDPPDTWSLLMLYYDAPQIDSVALENALKVEFGTSLSVSALNFSAEAGIASLGFGGDEMMLAQMNLGLPRQVLEGVLPVCHFSETEKQEFYKAKCHILISYKGREAGPMGAMSRIYAVTSLLHKLYPGAIGVLNEAALTAHPIRLMDALEKEKDQLQGPAMPFATWMAWTGGCVKYIVDANKIWFVTKGNHQFGFPELAFLGSPKEGNSTMELFNPLFAYMLFYKAKLSVGHTADLGGRQLSFGSLKEYQDLMEGKYGTLVVRKG